MVKGAFGFGGASQQFNYLLPLSILSMIFVILPKVCDIFIVFGQNINDYFNYYSQICADALLYSTTRTLNLINTLYYHPANAKPIRIYI